MENQTNMTEALKSGKRKAVLSCMNDILAEKSMSAVQKMSPKLMENRIQKADLQSHKSVDIDQDIEKTDGPFVDKSKEDKEKDKSRAADEDGDTDRVVAESVEKNIKKRIAGIEADIRSNMKSGRDVAVDLDDGTEGWVFPEDAASLLNGPSDSDWKKGLKNERSFLMFIDKFI